MGNDFRPDAPGFSSICKSKNPRTGKDTDNRMLFEIRVVDGYNTIMPINSLIIKNFPFCASLDGCFFFSVFVGRNSFGRRTCDCSDNYFVNSCKIFRRFLDLMRMIEIRHLE